MKFKRNTAFTLIEMMIAGSIGVFVGLGIVSFSWASARLGARNLACNHGNSDLTGTSNRLVKDLQSSASIFTLVDFNGTTYVDSTVSISADQDPLTAQYLSSRSNAVRFVFVTRPGEVTLATKGLVHVCLALVPGQSGLR